MGVLRNLVSSLLSVFFGVVSILSSYVRFFVGFLVMVLLISLSIVGIFLVGVVIGIY